jgi:type I restriction enzyme S subunit
MSFARYPAYKDSGVEWLGEVPAHWGVGQSRRLFSLRNERALVADKQLTASQVHGVICQEDFIRLKGRKVVEVIKGADILKHVEPNGLHPLQ